MACEVGLCVGSPLDLAPPGTGSLTLTSLILRFKLQLTHPC